MTHRTHEAHSAARLVCNARAVLGEGPLWVAREDAVYWVDIKGESTRRVPPAAKLLPTRSKTTGAQVRRVAQASSVSSAWTPVARLPRSAYHSTKISAAAG